MTRGFLAAALLILPATAHADWHEASSKHFVVYSEQSPERLKEFATNLERFDRAFRRLRGLPDDLAGKAGRVTVFVMNESAAVGKLARSDNVAGFYLPRASGSVAIVPRYAGSTMPNAMPPMAVLLHEYAHHLMMTASPNRVYPAWVSEGFAEFNATATFGRDGSVTFGQPPAYRVASLTTRFPLPLAKLFAADTLKLSDEERGGLYARGWLLTHYLAIGAPERKGQLGSYLDAVNAGKPSLEAAAAFGDVRRLENELDRYVSGRLAALKLNSDQLPVAPVQIRKLGAGAAALMDVRIRVTVGLPQKEMAAAYEEAKRAAAPYPNDAKAQAVLAEAAFAVRDLPAAEAAVDRAIAAAPDMIEPRIRKAKILFTNAARAGDRTPATWTAVRKEIAAANRLDADHPEPLMLFYRSYVQSRQKPTELAQKGLEYALEMAPFDNTLRFNVATMLMRNGEKERARSLLAPLAFAPHGKGFAQRAARLIAEIDAGEAKKALAELEGSDGGEDSPTVPSPSSSAP
ncbi:MAG TPA: hypothetical protein VM662_15935 [Sphingomonas sp.]|nr:hypothetical protein [Sphingomonas sp.]